MAYTSSFLKVNRRVGSIVIKSTNKDGKWDWGETSNTYSPRALEYALGHMVKNKVESAYQRDDLLLIRRSLMKDWANYLNRGQFIKENQGLKD